MKLQTWTDGLRESSKLAENFMASAESVLVSVIGRVACWLTPLPSAVLVSRAAERVFALDGIWAWVMAAVVELVGLVTSNLWLTAKEWNSNKKKSDPEANETLALALMIGYFVTTIALLLAFEIPQILVTGELAGLTSLLFPALSAVGVIALNERVLHHSRVEKVQESKSKKTSKTSPKPAPAMSINGQESAQKDAQNAVFDGINMSRQEERDAIMDAMVDIYTADPGTGVGEIKKQFGKSRSSIYNYRDALVEEGRISMDNGRVKVL